MTKKSSSPSIINFFPLSTVILLAILYTMKHEMFLEMLDFASSTLDIPKETVCILFVVLIFVIMALMKLIAMLLEARQTSIREIKHEKEEREVLLLLFDALNGKNWKDKTRWCSNEPIRTWKGVKVDPETKRVNKLILPDNNLTGFIPKEISKLEYLIEIDFRTNRITGAIPEEMCLLKEMQGLYLYDNFLEGHIPDGLSELPNLLGVYLFSNNFVDVLKDLSFVESGMDSSKLFISSSRMDEGKHTENHSRGIQFNLPSLPELIKVPPQSSINHGPPPPGYDMKTLRKQIEYYSHESLVLTDTQSRLYAQNEQLWRYIQELLDANRENAVAVRAYVSELNNELNSVYQERRRISHYLVTARSSQTLIEQLERELTAVNLSAEESEKLKSEALKALEEAKSQNDILEESLQSQLDRMSNIHDQLDSYHNEMKEVQLLEKADEFFFTNRVILKAAYSRFKAGVVKRLRMSRLHDLIVMIYKEYLITGCWKNWMKYMNRRRFMHRSDHRRNVERMELMLAKWKIHTALQTLFRRSLRKRLLSLVFKRWIILKNEGDYNKWALLETNHLQSTQIKRKSSVTFLDWFNPQIIALEELAKSHFIRVLFNNWRRVTLASLDHLNALATFAVPLLSIHKSFLIWHESCRARWRRRGQLLKRFYKQLNKMIKYRHSFHKSLRFAVASLTNLRMRSMIKKWMKFVRIKSRYFQVETHHTHLLQHPRYQSSNSNNNTKDSNSSRKNHRFVNNNQQTKAKLLFHYYHTKCLKSSWFEMILAIARLRHQRLAIEMAYKHYKHRKISLFLLKWKNNVYYDVRTRKKKRKRLLLLTFNGWKSFLLSSKREKLVELRITSYSFKRRIQLMKYVLYEWYERVKREVRLRRVLSYLSEKIKYNHSKRVFVNWRCQWTKALYWKMRSLRIESQRNDSKKQLLVQEVEKLEDQKSDLEKQRVLLEDVLVNLQELIAEKKNTIQKQSHLIAEKDLQRKQIADSIGNAQQELNDVLAERERLRPFEEMLRDRRSMQQREAEQKKKEAQLMLSAVLKEVEELRGEVGMIREQSYLSEKTADEQLSADMDHYSKLRNQSEEMLNAVLSNRQEVSGMEEQSNDLIRQINVIQQKLDEVSKQGKELIEENELIIRRKEIELRQLKSQTGLAESRVAALNKIISEYNGRRNQTIISKAVMDESREMADLAAIEAQLTSTIATSIITPSATPSSKLLHYNPSYAQSHINEGNNKSSSSFKQLKLLSPQATVQSQAKVKKSASNNNHGTHKSNNSDKKKNHNHSTSLLPSNSSPPPIFMNQSFPSLSLDDNVHVFSSNDVNDLL
eukprot:gene4078-5824_t